MIQRLKKRWRVESTFQAIIILIVFSLTGMATLQVRKAIWPYLGLEPETSLWIKVPLYILIIFPTYQVLQLIIAALFGQFRFFWEFEKKMFRRIGILSRNKSIIIIAFTLFTYNTSAMNQGKETATLGGGCFWCTEAVFLRMKGVEKVTPGYSGGHIKNPAYREVTTGRTGHAEVIQIVFDPKVTTYVEILEVFFATHDPTTLNRQGADVGTQYRSAIFYHTESQKKEAEKVILELERSGAHENPIVTEVKAFTNFYEAEDYHKNYFNNNRNQPYCRYVVAPKVEKFNKLFKDKIKP
ncbi:methionine-S-sulfoxide reductase [Bacteroidales bacterium 6E]|nr:methionine-S-sulfoxide reductase [Bacteroidales bacterium 6E]